MSSQKKNFEENCLTKFLEVCNKVLDKHAPSIEANQKFL